MPTDASMAEINRALGSLEGAVKSMQTQLTSHQSNSEDGRRRLYEKFEELSSTVNSEMRVVAGTISGLTTRVDGLAARVESMEPHVTAFKEHELIKKGATQRGQALWAWCAWAGAMVGYAAHELGIGSFIGRGTPHGP